MRGLILSVVRMLKKHTGTHIPLVQYHVQQLIIQDTQKLAEYLYQTLFTLYLQYTLANIYTFTHVVWSLRPDCISEGIIVTYQGLS